MGNFILYHTIAFESYRHIDSDWSYVLLLDLFIGLNCNVFRYMCVFLILYFFFY